ncbi:NAD-dependent epimerase/dehydratase family protein, partial [Bacteroides reticulotermitis]|uniref:FnlB protein n=2 Tax=Bacteroides reticulotermitis TaxID=1133319 RepID=W4UZT9_9BACE
MISVGITGQAGFVGTHLFAALGNHPDKFNRIPFEDGFFNDDEDLRHFVKRCDVVVHLAAMMRSPIESMVYETNMRLVNQIIDACNKENVSPAIMFASSIQEDNGSEYGRCKQEGRTLLMKWAEEHRTGFGGMIFPNIFGPLARPNSHSFIATFCYRLTHGEEPKVLVDNVVSLKFIDSLISELIPMLEDVCVNKCILNVFFNADYQLKVTEVLSILKRFKKTNIDGDKMVGLNSQVEVDLFKTFTSYKDYK